MKIMTNQVQELNRSQKTRIAVIGCGAIARMFHIPVLAGHDGVEIAAFVDRNANTLGELAGAYGVKSVVTDIAELDLEAVDGALVATPPASHAPIATALLRQGVHVLVEKPMAVTYESAKEMVCIAEEAGAVLAVAQFRRLFPSTRLAAALMAKRHLGCPKRFDFEEGHIADWEARTIDVFRRETCGGGVLMDTGSHAIDQLLAILPGSAVVTSCEHNAIGGVESECHVELGIELADGPVFGTVSLSRERVLRNSLRIYCENGVLELPIGDRFRVRILNDDNGFADPATEANRQHTAQLGWSCEPDGVPVYAAFRAELDDWLSACVSGTRPYLSAASVLPTVKLIDECYRKALPRQQEWVYGGGCEAQPHDSISRARSSKCAFPAAHESRTVRRILVTGATGFIGGRVVEVLHLRHGLQVRALVRQAKNASRLARLPVEMFFGDLRSPDDVAKAVEGCDAVVHCAYGTDWGRSREVQAVTIGGTRTVARAALAAGVSRFVHLSTWAIHGADVRGNVDETSPVHASHDLYEKTKAKAETVLQRAIRAGLPGVILRLTNVYGPFSKPFTVRPIEHLKLGLPMFVGAGSQPSNTVYVDNAVEAVICALQAPEDSVRGEVFLICDDDGLSWAEYHKFYADALGLKMVGLPAMEYEQLVDNQPKRALLAVPMNWCRSSLSAATSKEAIEFAKRLLNSDPLGTPIRYLFDRFPSFRDRVRREINGDERVVYVTGEKSGDSPVSLDLMRLYACEGRACTDKARKVLGYQPIIGREQAMRLTLEWARHANLFAVRR